jgi:S1-C subfamily serine protease
MVDKEIEDYIKNQKNQGVNNSEIRKALLRAGYMEHEFMPILARYREALIDIKSPSISMHHILLFNIFVVIFFGFLIAYTAYSLHSRMSDLNEKQSADTAELRALSEGQAAFLEQKFNQESTKIDNKISEFSNTLSTTRADLDKKMNSMEYNNLERDSKLSGTFIGITNKSMTEISTLQAKVSKVENSATDFTAVIPAALESAVTIGKNSNGMFTTKGSGAIFNDAGYIVTNYHVVDDISSISIKTKNNNLYTATLVGKDASWDIAVLKIIADKKTFSHLDFGDSSKVYVGQRVIAIGNPAGLESTVTEGIISNTKRYVSGETNRYFFQTDVAINSGNSGGPLIDKNGKIIGIVTSKYSEGGAEGLNFALRGNDVSVIVNGLMRGELND